MIIPDVNLLVYAHNPGAVLHAAARSWWEGLLDGVEEVGLPWAVSTGFMRLISNPGVAGSSLSPPAAVDCVAGWFGYNHVVPLNPGDGHLTHLSRLLDIPGSSYNLVPDAHIASLAIEHDAEVHTSDRDFARFPGLRWRNPLL